jgi:hypothetical protein
MKIYFSIPEQDIVECDLPAVPSLGHSIAPERDGKLHKVIGVVWDLALSPDDHEPHGQFEIWVFCDPDGEARSTFSPKIIQFPTGEPHPGL